MRAEMPFRVYDKMVVGTGCWSWLGQHNVQGYGRVKGLEGKPRMAHRVAYELLRGPIPAGLTLDHLCRNTSCVNPWHMEPVTGRVNTQRHFAQQTHCKYGHSLDDAYVRLSGRRMGHRRCRVCMGESNRAAYLRRRDTP